MLFGGKDAVHYGASNLDLNITVTSGALILTGYSIFIKSKLTGWKKSPSLLSRRVRSWCPVSAFFVFCRQSVINWKRWNRRRFRKNFELLYVPGKCLTLHTNFTFCLITASISFRRCRSNNLNSITKSVVDFDSCVFHWDLSCSPLKWRICVVFTSARWM